MGLTQLIDDVKKRYATFKENYNCPVDIYQIPHPNTQELHYFLVGASGYHGKTLNRTIWGTPLKKLLSKKLGFSIHNSTYKKIPFSEAKQRDLSQLDSCIIRVADGFLATYEVVHTKEQSNAIFFNSIKGLSGDFN